MDDDRRRAAPQDRRPGAAPVRVYVPVSTVDLARAVVTGEVPGSLAHAVTPAVREWYVDGDLEELELAALTDAAQVALAALAAQAALAAGGTSAVGSSPLPEVPGGEDDGAGTTTSPGVPDARPRRVVLAADAVVAGGGAEVAPVPGRGVHRSAVRLAAPLAWAEVVSVHVDEVEAEEDVVRALRAWPAALAGDGGAVEAVEDAEACDLLWYAPSEVPDLVRGWSARP